MGVRGRLWINLAEDMGLWRTAVKSLRNVLVQQLLVSLLTHEGFRHVAGS